MLFNSYIFIFLFLPITLAGYYACNAIKKYELGKAWLTVMSLWFYGYFNPSYLLIILSSILVNYGVYRFMRIQGYGARGCASGTRLDKEHSNAEIVRDEKRNSDSSMNRSRLRVILAAGLLFNIGLIFYFKYFDFFIENMNAIFGQSFTLQHILLPLGISFFTFQQISFLVDTYKGETEQFSFLDYALFVTFFPQLIAGPIVTHNEMIPQFQDVEKKHFSNEYFSKGLAVFILGLFKKVIVADTFGRAVDWGYQNLSILDSTNLILVALFYTIQLYFDFSGYCGMARGLGYLFNIEIPLNFHAPYKSRNISEFWTRWHMTLNRFLTRYVYIPLGGNRKGAARTYINLLLVFLVSGVWHGANWTFIIWGMLHGIACVIYRMGEKWFDRITGAIAVCGNFIFLTATWIFFRAESVEQALTILLGIAKCQFGKIDVALMSHFNLDEFWYILKIAHLTDQTYSKYYIGIVFIIITLIVIFFGDTVEQLVEKWKPKLWNAITLAGIFVWCVISMSEVCTFLYFNF